MAHVGSRQCQCNEHRQSDDFDCNEYGIEYGAFSCSDDQQTDDQQADDNRRQIDDTPANGPFAST